MALLNDSVFEFYRPQGKPNIQIVFFHGLQRLYVVESHITTWMSRRGSQCWPQIWLPEDFPGAQILSIRYDVSAYRSNIRGRLDKTFVANCLIEDMIHSGNIGQECPVVLVGHGVGGIVIKQLCILVNLQTSATADRTSKRSFNINNFLRNLKGFFYFSTSATQEGDLASSSRSTVDKTPESAVREYLKALSVESARFTEEFRKLRMRKGWNATGLVGTEMPNGESSRFDLDTVLVLNANGDTIARPAAKESPNYQFLTSFITEIMWKERIQVQVESSNGSNSALHHDQYEWFEDPLTWEIMCDPVKSNDGRTYDLWSIIDRNIPRSPYDPSVVAFSIVVDDIDVRRRLFQHFPEQERKCKTRRRKHREEAFRHADNREYEDAISKLNDVLTWARLDLECRNKLDSILNRLSDRDWNQGLESIPLGLDLNGAFNAEDTSSSIPTLTHEALMRNEGEFLIVSIRRRRRLQGTIEPNCTVFHIRRDHVALLLVLLCVGIGLVLS